MNKPKFNPSQPFVASVKPKFNPNAGYDPVSESVAPNEESFGRQLTRGVTASLPLIGGLGGGVLGAGAGLPAGPGAIVTALAGGAGGYAAGKELEGIANHYLLDDAAPADAFTKPVDTLNRVGGNLIEGAASEVLGMGVGALGMKLADKVISRPRQIVAKLRNLADRSAAKALGAERGTIKKLGEDRVLDIGRQALDAGVISPLAGTKDLMERNSQLKDTAMGARDAVYRTIDEEGVSQFNPLDAAIRVDEGVGDFIRDSPLNFGKNTQLENTLEAMLLRGDGTITMRKAQKLVKELGDAAKWSGMGRRTPREELAQKAYGIARNELNASAGRASEVLNRLDLQEIIEQSNRLYSVGKDTDTLLQNKYAREQGNKLIGLTDTNAAAGTLSTLGTPGVVAMLAAKRGAERYGNQILAVSADALAYKLAKSPQTFGRYAKLMAEASRRSGQAAVVLHQQLMKTEPEYRDNMRGEFSQ